MPITPSSAGSDPRAGPDNAAGLVRDPAPGAVAADNAVPSGNVGAVVPDSSAGITTLAMNGGTVAFNTGVITRPANGTCWAAAIRITTTGGGSSCGTIGFCRSIGG